jgi:6-phosphofructokinase 1
VADDIRCAYERGKAHALVVVAEGARYDAERLAAWFARQQARLGYEIRVTRLGHVQRGGSPGAFDRLLATELGAGAIECLARGRHGVLVGRIDGKVATTPLDEVVANRKTLDLSLLERARALAT